VQKKCMDPMASYMYHNMHECLWLV